MVNSAIGRTARRCGVAPVCLAAALACGVPVAAQDPPAEYAQAYTESFKGKPQKTADFALLGANADRCVKFEPQGLRVTLPPDNNSGPTGVATTFGIAGDFDISVRFEILQQNSPSGITLTVNLNQPVVKDAVNRPVVKNASMSCIAAVRVGVPRDPAGLSDLGTSPRVIQIFTMRKDAVRITDRKAAAFAVKEKAGGCRLVRAGENLSYYLSEGPTGEFKLLTTHPFAAADLKNLQLTSQASTPKGALDVRFTDLRIRAATVPKTIEGAPLPPPRDLPEGLTKKSR